MDRTVARAIAVILALGAASAATAQTTAQVGDVVAGPSASGTGLRFIARTGSVGFTVPSDWPVVGLQPRPPVAVAAFQPANPASDGTAPEATNVTVSVFHLSEPAAAKAVARVGERYGPRLPTTRDYDGWTIYDQEAVNDGTRYTVFDGLRRFPDLNLAVSVKLAWPHLAGNARNYGADMLAAYHALLRSVSATPGVYQTKPGEAVKRPS